MSRHCMSMINLLKDREHVVGAEIGVWQGEFASSILNGLPKIEKYYAVDGWELYDDFKDILVDTSDYSKLKYETAYRMYETSVAEHINKVVTLKMYSDEAAQHVPDSSLDFVFIDANHAYEYVKKDILLWTPKVKTGGIVSGHDYGKTGAKKRKVPFGVTEAVNEYFNDVNVLPGSVWWVIKK